MAPFGKFRFYNKDHLNSIFNMQFALPNSRFSSSCHQTNVFHLSTHFFAVSLNLLRSFNEQGCAKRVHCIMCAVFSVARPHSQVVSPS